MFQWVVLLAMLFKCPGGYYDEPYKQIKQPVKNPSWPVPNFQKRSIQVIFDLLYQLCMRLQMFLYLCKSGCTEIVEGGQLICCLFVDFNTDRGNPLALACWWHRNSFWDLPWSSYLSSWSLKICVKFSSSLQLRICSAQSACAVMSKKQTCSVSELVHLAVFQYGELQSP